MSRPKPIQNQFGKKCTLCSEFKAHEEFSTACNNCKSCESIRRSRTGKQLIIKKAKEDAFLNDVVGTTIVPTNASSSDLIEVTPIVLKQLTDLIEDKELTVSHLLKYCKEHKINLTPHNICDYHEISQSLEIVQLSLRDHITAATTLRFNEISKSLVGIQRELSLAIDSGNSSKIERITKSMSLLDNRFQGYATTLDNYLPKNKSSGKSQAMLLQELSKMLGMNEEDDNKEDIESKLKGRIKKSEAQSSGCIEAESQAPKTSTSSSNQSPKTSTSSSNQATKTSTSSPKTTQSNSKSSKSKSSKSQEKPPKLRVEEELDSFDDNPFSDLVKRIQQ